MGRGGSSDRGTLQLEAAPPPLRRFEGASVRVVDEARVGVEGSVRFRVQAETENFMFTVKALPWGLITSSQTLNDATKEDVCALGSYPCASSTKPCIHQSFMDELFFEHSPLTLSALRAQLKEERNENRRSIFVKIVDSNERVFVGVRILDDLFVLNYVGVSTSPMATYDASIDAYEGETREHFFSHGMIGQTSARLFARSDLAKSLVSLCGSSDRKVSDLGTDGLLRINKPADYPYVKRERVYNGGVGHSAEALNLYLSSSRILPLATVRPSFVCLLCQAAKTPPESCPHLELATMVKALR